MISRVRRARLRLLRFTRSGAGRARTGCPTGLRSSTTRPSSAGPGAGRPRRRARAARRRFAGGRRSKRTCPRWAGRRAPSDVRRTETGAREWWPCLASAPRSSALPRRRARPGRARTPWSWSKTSALGPGLLPRRSLGSLLRSTLASLLSRCQYGLCAHPRRAEVLVDFSVLPFDAEEAPDPEEHDSGDRHRDA